MKRKFYLVVGVLLLLLPTYKEYKSNLRTEEKKKEILTIEKGNFKKGNLNGEKGILIQSDKIDLEMPIEYGATFENMKDNVATIKYDSLYEGKNYSIAGHRYLTHGRHFNRIDEFEKGDLIQLLTDTGELINYRVYDKLVVEPEDVSVLEDTGKTEITLITCHPPGISSHRLVVKAEKEN